MPTTGLGWLAVWLLLAFAALLAAFFALVAGGERGGETLASNPWLTLTALGAATCAIVAGALALIAIAKRGERSVIVAVAVVLGFLVAVWVALEIALPH